MSKKKLILIPALLMALTACGPSSEPTSNPTTDPTSAPTSEPTTDPSVSDPTTSAPEVVATKIEIINKEELTAEWFVGNGDRNVNYSITYSDGTTKARGATVSSSNPDVISCPGGIKIHAQGAGTATVTVTVDSLSDSVEITVQPKAEIVAPTIAEILAGEKGAKTNARGELLQTSYGGYFIGDDTGIIYVYTAPDPTWKIGDTVAMAEAQIDEYGGIKQLKSSGENFYHEADIEDTINLSINYAAKTGAELSALTKEEKGKIIPVAITASIKWSDDYKHFWTMPGFDDKTILYSGYLNDADAENDLSDGARYEMTGFIAGSGTHDAYTNRLNFYPVSMKQVETIEVESIELAAEKETIEVGKTTALNVTFKPDGAAATVEFEITSGEDVISIEGTKATGLKTGTATVKAKFGDIVSNEITITVVEPAKGPQITKVTEPKVNTPYHLSFVQGNKDNTRYYFTGKMNGYYYDASTELADSTGIALETVEGGYNIVSLADGSYINVEVKVDGEKTYKNLKLEAEAKTVWNWNTTYNTLTTLIDGTEHYMGTYKNYETISLSSIDKAPTSFVSELVTVTIDPVVEQVNAPVANTYYSLGLIQGNKDNTPYYFTGKMNGYYFDANNTPTENVKLIEVEGGYNIQVIDGNYINVEVKVDGEKTYKNLKLQAEAKTVWTWNETYNTLTTLVDGVEHYMGTYSNYETISLSSIDKAPTSFVSHLYSVKEVFEEYKVAEPEVGVNYKLALVQGNKDNTTYYFTGKMNGYYYDLSTKDGVDVVLEEATDGYYIKNTLDNTYINVEVKVDGEKTYKNLKLEAEAKTVWNWNTTYNTLTTLIDGVEHYMGTYKTYETISLSSIDKAPTSFVSFLVKRYEAPTYTAKPSEPVDGEVTKTLSIADYAAANSWTDATLYDTVKVDDVVTVTATGTPVGSYSLNTGKYYTSSQTWRIYQNENPEVKFTAVEGYEIISITIEYGVKNSGTLTFGGENIASGTLVEVNAATAVFGVGNTGTATNGQAQIKSITVVYAAK